MELIDIIDRAATDAEFRAALAEDPFGTARAVGYDVDVEQVKQLMGMPDADEKELEEALQSRLATKRKGRDFKAECEGVRATAGVRG